MLVQDRLSRSRPASASLAVDRSHHPARVLDGPKLQIPDALPRASRQAAVRYWDAHGRTDQSRLDVCLRTVSVNAPPRSIRTRRRE